MRLLKTVNFGIDCTGLLTIGYTLTNDDGSEKRARTTTGVFEAGTNSGVYGCYIDFDQEWNGIILWDTGEDEPIYASEEYNYQLEDSTSNIDLIVQEIERDGGTLDRVENKVDVLSIDCTSMSEVVNGIDNKVDVISNDLKRALGLMHENIFIDLPTYDDDNNLIGARVRIYSDAVSVGTTNNVLATYIISSTGDGCGKFTNWKQVSA